MDTPPADRTRHLNWEPCWNTRDLGGLPTTDGRQTRWRALIRSDHLDDLTPAGRRALLDYGAIVDLRWPTELAAAGPAFPGGRPGEPQYHNVPLDRHNPAADPLLAAAQSRAGAYRILLEFYPHALAEALQAVADAPPGGVVVHCRGGVDRTAIVTAAALRLAGVTDGAIAADYALTLERVRPLYERLLAERGEAGLGFWDRLNMTADQMLDTLAYVDARYGGLESYLRRAGLSDAAMERIRARLRE